MIPLLGQQGDGFPTRTELAWARAGLGVGGLYPVWHLMAPASVRDPWGWWWAVGACFGLVLGLSLSSSRVARLARPLFHACAALITLHLFLLCASNDMHPFFAMGSFMSVLAASIVIASRRIFIAYGCFVTLLIALGFVFEPSLKKAAYWFPLLTILPVLYSRLLVQQSAEGMARRYREQLEARVAERTRELRQANERLSAEMQEREQLEHQLRLSDRMKALGRLAGGIAHDFNNLLTAIQGYADLLLHETDQSSQRHYTAEIQRAATRSASLTRQLLAFSRQNVIQPRALDLNAALRGMADMLRAVEGDEIRVDLRLGENLDPVRADPAQLEQVVLNLALNARDAMPSGGQLIIETTGLDRDSAPPELVSELSEDEYLVLRVRDNGTGMDPATRDRIFEPFFTTKEVGQGSGLGLSSVYGIVRQSGGQISVSSAPGEGACFQIYWPCAHAGTVPMAVALPSATFALGSKESEHILLVEDDSAVRAMARRVLERSGYEVRESPDAETALYILEDDETRIDLMVTDVVMPRMSGLDLADRLRILRPDVKVLLISGHLDHPSLGGKVREADHELLPKPFSGSDLSSKVREILDRDEQSSCPPA